MLKVCPIEEAHVKFKLIYHKLSTTKNKHFHLVYIQNLLVLYEKIMENKKKKVVTTKLFISKKKKVILSYNPFKIQVSNVNQYVRTLTLGS